MWLFDHLLANDINRYPSVFLILFWKKTSLIKFWDNNYKWQCYKCVCFSLYTKMNLMYRVILMHDKKYIQILFQMIFNNMDNWTLPSSAQCSSIVALEKFKHSQDECIHQWILLPCMHCLQIKIQMLILINA